MTRTKGILYAAPIVLALCTTSQAEIMDLSSMITDASDANAGQELITPQFRELSQGEEGCAADNGCFTFRFKVSKIVPSSALKPATHLYYTPEKILSYPSCGSDETYDTDWEPKFLLVGKTAIAGFNVSSECGNTSDPMNTNAYEKNASYLYMTNISAAQMLTKVYSYSNGELVGLNATSNLNGAGSGTDLMATMNYFEGSNAGKLQIDVFEPTTYSRYISNIVIIGR